MKRALLLLILFVFHSFSHAQDIEWEFIGGPEGGTVLSIDEAGGALYAGTMGSLYRSDDGGSTWNRTSLIASVTGVGSSGGSLLAATGGGMYRSEDDGITWGPSTDGMTSRPVTSLAVTEEGVVYAGTGGLMWIGGGITSEGGLFRSTDQGKSWQEVMGSTEYNVVWDVEIDATGTIYAATINGLFRSEDEGETWNGIGESGYAIHSNGSGRLILATENDILRSEDGGESWTVVSTETVIRFVESNNTLFASTFGISRIVQSTDDGRNWTPLPFDRGRVLALAVAGTGDLFAGTLYRGLYRSPDGGQTWQENQLGFSAHPIHAFEVHPSGDLFAGTYYIYDCGDYCGSDGAVYRSSDGGLTWESTTVQGAAVTDFAVGPDDDLYASTLEGLYLTEDRGHSWTLIPTDSIFGFPFAVHVTEDGTVLVGVDGIAPLVAYGIFRLDDDDETWVMETSIEDFTPISRFVSIDGSVIAGGGATLRRKAEGDWELLTEYPSGGLIATGPNGRLYRATEGNLYRSDDLGETWQESPLPVPYVADLAVTSEGHILLSSWQGLYGSYNGGETWKLIGDRTNRLFVFEDDHVFSFPSTGGIERSLSPVRVDIESPLPERAESVKVYPNPFSSSTTVAFYLPRSARATITVYNLLGERVARLVDGPLPAGDHSTTWGADGLPSGIYFIRLQTESMSSTHKVMLLR